MRIDRNILLAATLTAALPAAQLAAAPPEGRATAPLKLVYFYSPTCGQCAKAAPTVDAMEKKYPDRVTVERHSIATNVGLELLFAYEDRHGSREPSPPKVFVADTYLHGAEAIQERLGAVVAGELRRRAAARAEKDDPDDASDSAPPQDVPGDGASSASGVSDDADSAGGPGPTDADGPPEAPPGAEATADPAPTPPSAGGHSKIQERFRSFGLPAIALAGLIDGVNPCAFTTIVFLLSAVAHIGRTRREVAIVGFSFTVAVFVTYLLLGLGLLLAIKAFAVQTGLSRWLTWTVAGLAFALAAWSLWDGIRVRASGKVPRFSLGLPGWIKRYIHRVIHTGLRGQYLVIGSFAVGCGVSLLESFCTGQVYVPTIMLVLQMPGQRYAALGYLLLYNVAFILPLVVIMLLAYLGVRSERLARIARRHLGLMKFAMAGVFAGLGTLLLLLS